MSFLVHKFFLLMVSCCRMVLGIVGESLGVEEYRILALLVVVHLDFIHVVVQNIQFEYLCVFVSHRQVCLGWRRAPFRVSPCVGVDGRRDWHALFPFIEKICSRGVFGVLLVRQEV